MDTQKYKAREDAISQEIGSETVILDLNGSTYFGLDEVATNIWQLIHEPATIDEVTDALVSIYEVDREVLKIDVEKFMNDMLAAGIAESL